MVSRPFFSPAVVNSSKFVDVILSHGSAGRDFAEASVKSRAGRIRRTLETVAQNPQSQIVPERSGFIERYTDARAMAKYPQRSMVHVEFQQKPPSAFHPQ